MIHRRQLLRAAGLLATVPANPLEFGTVYLAPEGRGGVIGKTRT